MADIDWSRWLRAGDHLVCSHMSAEPVALLASLARAADLPAPLHCMLGVPFSMTAQDLPPHVELTTYGGMGSGAALARQRTVQRSLLTYGQVESVYTSGTWRCDVVLVALGRAPDGQLYLSPTHGPVLAAARQARHIIAQVSPNVPWVQGAEWPADLRIDALLEVEDLPLLAAPTRQGDTERRIAEHVAALVPDGACLQVGIGGMPSAVLERLSGHRHLGLHSGMLTPPMWTLMESGAADHSRKVVDPGVATVGCVYGDEALYAAVHRHPAVALRAPSHTHALSVIAAQPDMFCLNSALEVDLMGSVNAEAVVQPDGQWRYLGGVGGLPEFVRAAVHAPRGQSVIALAATTPQGVSRIVPRLQGPTTLSAGDADMIVTEYGIARLRGASLSERAQALIAIAAPDARDALHQQARHIGLL